MLRPSDTQRIGAAIHSVRAVDPLRRWSASRDVGAATTDDPRPRVRADGRERAVPRVSPPNARSRCSPRPARCRIGSPRSTPRTSPRATWGCSAAAGSTCAMCPTTERDLGDGIGPTDRVRCVGDRRLPGVGLPCGDRSPRGGPRIELDERLAAVDEVSTRLPNSLPWRRLTDIAVSVGTTPARSLSGTVPIW